MNISKENPGLLLLDNHQSHISLVVINIAEENGLNILTFPPHCSHRLQFWDNCMFGPFKAFYYCFCDSWMMSNSGQLISIYKVAELIASAFVEAFNPENITSASKKCEIFFIILRFLQMACFSQLQ